MEKKDEEVEKFGEKITLFPTSLKHGSGVMMTLDLTRLLLGFKEAQDPEEVEQLLKDVGFVLEDADQKNQKKSSLIFERVNHTDRHFWIRSRNREPISQKLLVTIDKKFKSTLDWIGPVYSFPNMQGRRGLLCPIPNVLLIKPFKETSNDTEESLSDILNRYGLKKVQKKSKYLGDYNYYIITDVKKIMAYQLQRKLLDKEKQFIKEARFENMPMVVPTAVVPNDTFFPRQWNMTQIQAGGTGTTGWDISTGNNTIIVCILDEGCELTHPDLQFSTPGINLDTMLPDGSPTGNHGTACAGIAAGRYNNSTGVAGVAGNCQIMPLAVQNWTDVEVAAGINYAADNGAHVISMSFGWNAWDHAIIDPAIQHAFDSNVVMCVATHNDNISSIRYPATNPLVMACGASDQVDNRKTDTSPDNECWGSNYGPEISVVAPGVIIPTTDIQGNNGYNDNNGGLFHMPCVDYANCGDASGDYFFIFNGTSAATPHVAGLAALLLSQYPTLSNVDIRNIIERTAERVGILAYAETSGYLNGPWNQEMGYGRINVLRALDFADLLIKDWPGDSGIEPSNPPGGNYWSYCDVVIRPTDDDVFIPDDPTQSKYVKRGQINYLYIRVTNNGPREAHNVIVNARITPFVGLQFVYPDDWTINDVTHVSPTPINATFASIPSGGSVIAKFNISSAQVEDLWGWESGNWTPCLLAEVKSDNDYAFANANLTGLTGGSLIKRYNNLVQRNLSVIESSAGASAAFPFIAGHRKNAERFIEIVIDRRQIPKDMKLMLSLDEDITAFPRVDLTTEDIRTLKNRDDEGIIFMERTKIKTSLLHCCRGILTLEKGSRFDCLPSIKIGKVNVKGGEVILKGNKRFVDIKENNTSIRMEKQPNQLYPFTLNISIPEDAKKEEKFIINIAQKNEKGEIVGGATAIHIVK